MNKPSNIYEIIHSTVSNPDNRLSISYLCQISGVSRSGYYSWVNGVDKRKAREEQDKSDFELILKAYSYRGYDKGIRGIHMRLLHMDPPILMNVKKIQRLMHKYNLKCPIRKANPYRRMIRALKTNTVADNLVNRDFKSLGPGSILLTDITYLPYNGTFAYLSVILDAYTKQILSYSLSDSLKIDFVLDTVEKLFKYNGDKIHTDAIIHSDQGSHYTSHKFIDLVSDFELRQSMSRRGNCWDNAPRESFFGHMKDEIDLSKCKNFDEVNLIIDDFIDYYNNDRYQWALAKLSPNEYFQYISTGIYPIK